MPVLDNFANNVPVFGFIRQTFWLHNTIAFFPIAVFACSDNVFPSGFATATCWNNVIQR
jgi:hypothetical protein